MQNEIEREHERWRENWRRQVEAADVRTAAQDERLAERDAKSDAKWIARRAKLSPERVTAENEGMMLIIDHLKAGMTVSELMVQLRKKRN